MSHPAGYRPRIDQGTHISAIHDFDNTVIAVLQREPAVRSAVESLSEAGYDYEVLEGEEGQAHLDPKGQTGPVATIKRLVNAFGDQHRVIDRLDDELSNGKMVVSVEASPERADDAVRILLDHGGDFVWKFGTWAFTRLGD